MVYSGFAGQGAALAIAFACHVRARWGRQLLMFGTGASEPGWSLTETMLVIKVVIGVLAAAVAALVVTAAVKDDQKPAGT